MNREQMRKLVLDKVQRECISIKDQDVIGNSVADAISVEDKNKGAFLSRANEYFQNKTPIKRKYLNMMLEEPLPVSFMWELYQKSVWLDFETWAEMEEILEDMFCYRKACLAA